MGLPSPAVGVVEYDKELRIQIVEGGKPIHEFSSLNEFCTELFRKITPVSEEAIVSLQRLAK